MKEERIEDISVRRIKGKCWAEQSFKYKILLFYGKMSRFQVSPNM